MTTENELNQAPEAVAAFNAQPVPMPAVSAENFTKRKPTTLEGIEADAVAEQAELAAQIRSLSLEASKIKQEQGEVEAALYAAEGRLRVLASPSRTGYVSARAELAAKALMGESVDLSSVPAEDTAASMSVGDVQAGIVALKKRRDSLENDFRSVRSRYVGTAIEFCRQHGVMQACRAIKAKRMLTDAVCGLMAAEDRTRQFIGENPILKANVSFMPLHFEHEFKVPAFNDLASLMEVKNMDMSTISYDLLRSANSVGKAVEELNAAMAGGAA